MGKAQRSREPRECSQCKLEQSVLYRVKTQAQGDWLFLCSDCQKHCKQLPDYQYGGTWKQKKRN
ncbi:hypothetical protein ACFO4O_00910 [Glaciecola siphonariae]|uniref:Uncharacterized protein n=1 Tax=Glaciecola siphonariae TaxID=521012 RepID=A0ABV9LRH4_9ALTE